MADEPPRKSSTGTVHEAVGPSDTRPDSTGATVQSFPIVVPESRPLLPESSVPPELSSSGEYAEVRELGRGGMGVVYIAKNTMMGRLEVLKVVNRAKLSGTGADERFFREIHATAKVRHPNIVTAYSVRQMGGLIVFAMEYVPGTDLAQVVRARGPLPIGEACDYVRQAAQGLQHAHAAGMVHRDVKPSNLILGREGERPVVKILDFGLAKGVADSAGETPLTGEGVMLGTPGYVAPEQIRDGAAADGRSDVYSLGCTLYHLLAGRPPFAGKTVYATLTAQQTTDPPKLKVVRPDVPDGLVAVVARMMAKDSAARYPTPGAAAEALHPFVNYAAIAAPTNRSGRWPVVVGCALVLAVVAAWAGGLFRTTGPTPTHPDQPTAVAPLPGEERSFDIAAGVTTSFCWVPAGSTRLGSPRAEQDAVTRTYLFGQRPDYLDAESEVKRGTFRTNGFWLAKYPVTQAEWKAVTKTTPSYFAPTGSESKYRDRIAGLDTSRFPVENVSWDDCRKFLDAVNARPGSAAAFGKPGRFVLPHEDEWEYACRGGLGNSRAFYFGDALNGTRANCDGEHPFGTATEGPYRQRPTPVGSYTSHPHPWGLGDMHGNVFQWCENAYDATGKDKVLRGGSWSYDARDCRSAYRFDFAPDIRSTDTGVRIAYRFDPTVDDLVGTWTMVRTTGDFAAGNVLELDVGKDHFDVHVRTADGARTFLFRARYTYDGETARLAYESVTPGNEKKETMTVTRLTAAELHWVDSKGTVEEFKRTN